jgi:integrase
MNCVEPIRDRVKLEELKEELKRGGTRDYILFLTGINTGLRISDLVKLNYNDIRNEDNTMKNHITIIEKKTNKIKKFPLCNTLLVEIEKYTRNMHKGEFLFASRKGINKPITTTQAYRIIINASNKIGLENIGTHSMRKTFGYFHYQQFKDIALLQEILNHSSASITLRYIGINQENIDLCYKNFSL